jgi:oligopeptide/dipeptide ABC transporter ATP-binding protein
MPESVNGTQLRYNPHDQEQSIKQQPVLELDSVTIRYKNERFLEKLLKSHKIIRPAVSRVSLEVFPQKVLGLVGESGCGKSTIAKSILMLTALEHGSIYFHGKDLTYWEKYKKQYYSQIQMIWQDPFSSINSKMRVKDIIRRPLVNFTSLSKKDVDSQVEKIISYIGLSTDHLAMYPHELSGGGRQRITIARALICKPQLLIADEPTSALDVSIQAQILNLLKKLQRNMQLTMLVISHNLSVIHFLCDKIAVMYAGKIIEIADKDNVFQRHRHWYTKLLYESVPIVNKQIKRDFTIDLGELQISETGCPFALRCINVKNICYKQDPELIEVSKGHNCACHFPIER